jgi:hypothetical protein
VGTVRSTTLLLNATNPSTDGPKVYATGNSWNETKLTWNSQTPPSGAALADALNVPTGTLRYLLSANAAAGGNYNYVLMDGTTDNIAITSREAATNKPLMVVTYS